MEIGVCTFVTDESIGPAELGRALEERGFESLMVAEHSHFPVKRETPRVADLPRHYFRTLDPLVTLTAAASVTRRLSVGTAIALVIERDPIHLAKEMASLDQISGGRAVFGVGAGWVREEMRNHGTDARTRTALLRERVLAIRAIWTQDEAEYHGRYVDFHPIQQWPKPVQRPHPPILVGGEGPRMMEQAVEYGDGWMPRAMLGLDVLSEKLAEVRRRAEERGRRPPSVTVFGAAPERADLDRFAEEGVDRVLLLLPTLPRDETLRTLDDFAALLP
ncbi:MAG: TIGR03619 family F420-dependent LLM class oxidoreductase [Streptosporangiales bacterium]|nr:TIGR03619 family F420-dependent LLM class oxidoreductase [Streptosporangiales bacterium]